MVVAAVAAGTAVTAPLTAPMTVDQEIKFGAPNDKVRAALRQLPAGREIAAGDFVIAAIDLDGDGTKEIILLSRSSAMCLDGRCTLLVIQRAASGANTLLLRRVPAPLALTRELVNGYRAIAALDANGKIAVGDRRDGVLFGKPLVYAMRESGAQADPTAGALSSAPPRTQPEKPTLEDIVNTLAQRADEQFLVSSWESTDKVPAVKWQHKGLTTVDFDFRRAGTLAMEGIGPSSVTWSGPRAGPDTATVKTSVRIQKDHYSATLKQQFAPTAVLTQIRGACAGKTGAQESSVYKIVLTGRKPMFLLVEGAPASNAGKSVISVSREQEKSWACA